MKKLDWKTKSLCVAIFFVVVFLIKKIFFNGERNKKVKINRLMLDGMRNDKNKEYQTAIYFFKQALSLTDDPVILNDAYFAIAGCYFNLKKYEEAILYCTKCLEINLEDNLLALNMKFRCYYNLGCNKEYLQDLVLFDSLVPQAKNKQKIEDMTESICIERARIYCRDHVLPPSNIRYSDFFDTLIGILPVEEDDEVVYMIRSKQYDKLNETFFRLDSGILKSIESQKGCSNKLFSHNLIHSCLYYLKGNYEKAKELLRDSLSEFDLLFFQYLTVLTKEKTSREVDLSDSILLSENPSFIYYISKIYSSDLDYDGYLANILRIVDYPFAYSDVLSFFSDRKDDTKFRDFAVEGMKKFGRDMKMLFVCAKYSLERRAYDLLDEVLSMMPDNDARKHIVTGLINSNDQRESSKHFITARDMDPTCHEAYILLSKSFMHINESDCRFILSESLRIASNFDEALVSLKALLDLDNQDYVKNCINRKGLSY